MLNQPDSIGQGVEKGASLMALASHDARDGFRLGRRGNEASASSSSGNTRSSQLGSHTACAPLPSPVCTTSVDLHHTLPCASSCMHLPVLCLDPAFETLNLETLNPETHHAIVHCGLP